MGSSGIKRRKPRHRLPRLRGDLVPEREPSNWTPMGVVNGYGKIFRAMGSPDRHTRLSGTAVAIAIALPAVVLALVGLVALVIHM